MTILHLLYLNHLSQIVISLLRLLFVFERATHPNFLIFLLEFPHLLTTLDNFFLKDFDFLALLVILVIDSLLALFIDEVLLF